MKKSEPSEIAPRGTLIIGYGNALRGDDGAGPCIVEWVEQQQWPDVTTLSAHQLFPEMAEQMAQHERVIFVDADAATVDAVGLQPIVEASDRLMAHRCSPGSLVRMARELYGARPAAFLYTIPARCFDVCTTFSPLTRNCVRDACNALTQLLAKS
ncbi:MAG: hydrogenase maturation protease [Kiritimatiellae bacterium]|nr:hydrogenase maturation protease [Kiritimatiellia bacterium]MCO5062243.1 hydrogenase maturation protease [Kiritimatiellia bacterium]MCO5067207.1 hydrogenase maturation protease [Kiritimatiellia bacterium]MCO6399616.1 hydrogenase maturation protease [Verrucomicrobiota bacterium]